MTHETLRHPAAVLAFLLGLVGSHSAQAQGAAADVPGGYDHPLIQRFTGSWLIGHAQTPWDLARLPGSTAVNGSALKDVSSVEGKITRLLYIGPVGKSPLEVQRNYEQALIGAGFQTKLSCESKCENLFFAWNRSLDPMAGMNWVPHGSIPVERGSVGADSSTLGYEQGRMIYGTLPYKGSTAHVLLYTSLATNEQTRRSASFIEIIEPKPMQTGQVTVNAQALQSGLQADGRIALYGILFDTGKAEIKAESQPQLDEMARLLRSQPALKVFIVGHTDNAGGFDANLALSAARAQAVVAALSRAGINPQRLAAKGLANLAPVASNAEEAGRTRNRRVEMVLQ